MKKFLITLLAVMLVFSFAGCAASNNNSDDNKPSAKTTFGLNETATFKNLKVTATEMKESVGEAVFDGWRANQTVTIQHTKETDSMLDTDDYLAGGVFIGCGAQIIGNDGKKIIVDPETGKLLP